MASKSTGNSQSTQQRDKRGRFARKDAPQLKKIVANTAFVTQSEGACNIDVSEAAVSTTRGESSGISAKSATNVVNPFSSPTPVGHGSGYPVSPSKWASQENYTPGELHVLPGIN